MSTTGSTNTTTEGGSRQHEEEKVGSPRQSDGPTGTHNPADLPPAAGDAPDLLPPLHFSYHKQYIVLYVIFLFACNFLVPILLFYPLFFCE